MRSLLSLIPWISGACALGCIALFPLWVLGVPGSPDRQSNYVRGWTMGFNVLWLYPLGWALNTVPFWAGRRFVDEAARAKWESAQPVIALVLVIAGLARLIQSVVLLAKS